MKKNLIVITIILITITGIICFSIKRMYLPYSERSDGIYVEAICYRKKVYKSLYSLKYNEKKLEIPAQINGKDVVAVKNTYNSSFRHEIITFEEIVLPNTIKEIDGINGNYPSFNYKLNKINIPDTIEKISIESFKNTTYGNRLYQEKGYISGGNKLFSGKYCELSICTIGSEIEEIMDHAFSGNSKITEIYMNEGIKIIGFAAFSDCAEVKSIHLPESLEKIGVMAFIGVVQLEQIIIPENVKTIDRCIFGNRLYDLKIFLNVYEIPSGWDARWNEIYENNYYPYYFKDQWYLDSNGNAVVKNP